MRMLKKYSNEYKKQLLEALKTIENLECPPEGYRKSNHNLCFYNDMSFQCRECCKYALEKSLEEDGNNSN